MVLIRFSIFWLLHAAVVLFSRALLNFLFLLSFRLKIVPFWFSEFIFVMVMIAKVRISTAF